MYGMRVKRYCNHSKVRFTLRLWVLRLSVEFDVPND
jgi:hypothetical protein